MTFTKERLEQYIKNPLEHGLTRSEQMEMARQLLAGLEQEPVYQVRDWHWYDAEKHIYEEAKARGEECRVLYAAPQLPQPAVPDEVIVLLNHLEDVLPDEAFNLIDVKTWNNVSMLSRPEVYRAAMLQGAEPAQAAYKFPTHDFETFTSWLTGGEGMPEWLMNGNKIDDDKVGFLLKAYRAGAKDSEPVSQPLKFPSLEYLGTVKFNADCAIQDPESIYANEFFLSLDEVFGERGDYSEPVQAKAVSMLIAEVFRLHGYSPAAPQQEAE